MMTTQIELASRTLFDPVELNVRDAKLFPGTNRSVTEEQVAEQINLAINQIMAGNFEDMPAERRLSRLVTWFRVCIP